MTGRGDRYAITVHRVGTPPPRIERDVPAAVVETDEADNARDWLTAQMRDVDPNWRWSGPGVPETKPFFTRLLTAADGRIWVERPQPGERLTDEEYADAVAAQSGWRGPPIPPRRRRETIAADVFEADGRFLGHVAPPSRTTLRLMYGNQVWGVTRDLRRALRAEPRAVGDDRAVGSFTAGTADPQGSDGAHACRGELQMPTSYDVHAAGRQANLKKC